MEMISETATVTSKSMVNIPSKIRKKYSIKKGTRIIFVENENGSIEIIPVPPLSDLFGVDSENKEALIASIRELHAECRREVAFDKKKHHH